MAKNQNIRIRLKAFDHRLIDNSAREIVEFSVEPIVAFAPIEERRDCADVILVIARVEQEAFLPLQFRRAGDAIDIALAHDEHSRHGIRDAGARSAELALRASARF